jgi:hypothetical protein
MDNAVLELTEAVLRAPTRAEQWRLSKGFGAIIRAGLKDEWRAAQALKPDVIVYHSKVLGGHHITEKLGAAEFLGDAAATQSYACVPRAIGSGSRARRLVQRVQLSALGARQRPLGREPPTTFG